MTSLDPGRWLRKKRKEKKLSLRELAELSDLPFMGIQRMEVGKQVIGLDDAAKLAPHIDVTYEEFVAVLARHTLRQERKAANG